MAKKAKIEAHLPDVKPKSTNAEIEIRVDKIYEHLVTGLSRRQIFRYVAENTTWNMSERTIDEYIAKANAKLEAGAATVRERELGKAIARLTTIHQACMRIQDYSRAIAAQKELNLLLGLHEPTKSEVNINFSELSDDELRNIIAGQSRR